VVSSPSVRWAIVIVATDMAILGALYAARRSLATTIGVHALGNAVISGGATWFGSGG
jgi:hypothetical protein